MAGPSWLAGSFAAVMILIAVYSAGRLVVSRARGRATEFDADGLHAVMGTAMAGMLTPRLSLLPDGIWATVFGIAAAWFGWHAIQARGSGRAGVLRCRYPVPHLVECVAMLYMLLPVHGLRPAPGGAGMAMSGMSTSPGHTASFPALAVVLALFMLGYVMWTTDRLTSLARAQATMADPGVPWDHQPRVTVPLVRSPHGPGDAPGTPGAARIRREDQAGLPVLAPKLAACSKIAMSIAMGYMLILML
jgi:hypothetical protein